LAFRLELVGCAPADPAFTEAVDAKLASPHAASLQKFWCTAKRKKVRFLLEDGSPCPARLKRDGESFYEMSSTDRDSAVLEGVV